MGKLGFQDLAVPVFKKHEVTMVTLLEVGLCDAEERLYFFEKNIKRQRINFFFREKIQILRIAVAEIKNRERGAAGQIEIAGDKIVFARRHQKRLLPKSQ